MKLNTEQRGAIPGNVADAGCKPGESRKEKEMYNIHDARREVKELIEEGYGFGAIRIFLNDLARGRDITWEENKQLLIELIDTNIDCGITTF